MWSSLVLCLSLAGLGTAVQCPDGQICFQGTSCCQLPGGRYGCCPFLLEIRDSLRMIQTGSLNDISGSFCPNKATCPSEYSCLETHTGSYSCCPFVEAVSCYDGRHCCPRGFRCSNDGRSCLQHSESSEANAIVCPDGESECPNESTCCEMQDHSWGCCPMPKAICCDDKVHCCPHSTSCDVAHGKCTSAEGEEPMWTKFSARKRAAWEKGSEATTERVTCHDGSTCPNGNTCCILPDQGNNLVALFTKTPAIVTELHRSLEIRCDDSTSCADGNTCCKTTTGEWGCCPMLQAVCCTDHIHCCPNGYTCDVEKETCDQGEQSIPWLTKIASIVEVTAKRSKDVQCDDTSSCEDGNTCCKTSSGGWACCPLPNAVCCSDHVHCCPNGYTCDVEQGSCHQGHESTPWLIKTPADKKVVQRSKDVQCDGKSSCPDGNTCCKRDSGDWGCCPLEKAVCCSDHIHCCPNGYTCNVEEGTCVMGSRSVSWHSKNPANIKNEVPLRGETSCDETSSCPKESTCCRLASSEWACCPLLQAVCCTDGFHCCPSGYRCAGESCVLEQTLRWDNNFFGNKKLKIL